MYSDTNRFVEDSVPPTDAAQVDYTWQYVNVKGGPDRRFASNRVLPIMLYGQLDITTLHGLYWRIQISRADAAAAVASVLSSAPQFGGEPTAYEKSTTMTDNTDDQAPQFAELADSPDGLEALLRDKPTEWRWAAFASVLVQRRNALASDIRDHRIGYASQTGERITNTDELRDLVRECVEDADALRHELSQVLGQPGFAAAFGARDSEEGADAEGIIHNANRVMDYYERFLRIAQRANGVAAPAEFVTVLKNTAQVVDRPLTGMDRFIDHYVDVVRMIPAMLLSAEGEHLSEQVTLDLFMDDDLLDRITRQLDELDEVP